MSLAETDKTLVNDPVCGMSVDPTTAKHSSVHDERTYFFCCAGCRTKFAADPARYLTAAPSSEAHHRDHATTVRAPSGVAAKDPVCRMSVDPTTAKHSLVHDGRTYFFCCAGCRTKFAADPARYLTAAPSSDAHHRDHATTVTAPSGVAAKDPVCGMSVDPATAKHSFEHDGTTYFFLL